MGRLSRPYVPLSVRVQVAHRQLSERGGFGLNIAAATAYVVARSDGARLSLLLEALFGDTPYALDHHPALVNRRKVSRGAVWVYDPPANDPRYLVYREAGPVGGGSEHDIKTRIRGEGAALSDLAEARKAKRVRKNRARGTGAAPVTRKRTQRAPTGSGLRWVREPKNTKWAREGAKWRPANRWPPKGSRKLNWRKP